MTNTLSLPTRLISAPPFTSSLPHVPAEDRFGQGMLLGLVVATVPAVAYALLQAWNLASGDALMQAVRTFMQ